ncbi:MAG: DNA polymerase III subunit delta [Lautropia sp.]|nr:DNA polymerase III subunit delta [Lautropia sp.]
MGSRISTTNQLRQALGRQHPSLVWISGDEPLLVIEAADVVRAHARQQGFEEREVVDIEGRFDRSTLLEATRSQSLFASRKLVDIRVKTKPSKELGDVLLTLIGHLDDDIRLLLTCGRMERATTSTAWFLALTKQMLWVDTPRVDVHALPGWIAERLATQRQRATPEVLGLIADRTEGNLLAAHQAIQRLGLLLPEGELPAEAVAEIVLDSARFELFGMVDSALAGKTGRTLRMARSLAAEDAALPLLSWALADAIRKLQRIRQNMAKGQPMAGAMRSAGVFGRREALMRQALHRLDDARLNHLLRQVGRLDRMSKGAAGSGPEVDPWFHAETLLIALSGGRLPAPAELSSSLAESSS